MPSNTPPSIPYECMLRVPAMGSYYKVEANTLYYTAMLQDGGIDTLNGKIYWSEVSELEGDWSELQQALTYLRGRVQATFLRDRYQ